MWWIWLLGGVVVVLALALFWRFVLTTLAHQGQQARQSFAQQRSHLETQFFTAAAQSGKPRGLRWKELHWGEKLEFVRDRQSGQIGAIVAVAIQFEAVEGSDMEGVPAVKDAKNASAFFVYHQGQWQATGKAFFNMNPDEAVAHFEKQFERLGNA
jgi:hypothetical protein